MALKSRSAVETHPSHQFSLTAGKLPRENPSRLFPTACEYTQPGSDASPELTFVNGNSTLDGGAGLLIVTGNLTLNGNPDFNGIVLVLGNGHVERDGSVNGLVLGSIYAAKLARSWPASENGQPHPFLAPTFITNGAGNSRLQYDSECVEKAKDVLGTIVRDIREF